MKLKTVNLLFGQVGLIAFLSLSSALGQPANDDFDNAAILLGPVGVYSGSTTGATREPGEPSHWINSAGFSVWHTWNAPYDGTVVFDTVGSYFDTVLAVYTGTNVGALTLIGNNDDYPGLGFMSRVIFNAVAGTEYKIAVDGFGNSSGLYVLNWYYQTQQTNPPAPPLLPNQIQFEQSSYAVQENTPGFITVTVLYGGGNTTPVTVNYETVDGTAVAGTDYIGKSGQLVFNRGETNKTISIVIIDNSTVNSNKTFNVRLFNPGGGATLGLVTNTVVTIIDDETIAIPSTAGQFQFSASLYSVTEREYALSAPNNYRSIPGALITVNRVNGSTGRVMVDYIVTNEPIVQPPVPGPFRPAEPYRDYIPDRGTLVFDDGQTSTNFMVRIDSDFISNGTARVTLLLSNPRPAPEENPALIRPSLGNPTNAILQIVEISHAPQFSFERLNYRVDEYGNKSLTIAVILPGGGGPNVGVDVVMGNPYYYGELSAGSDYARPGVDYTVMTQRLNFSDPNVNRLTITIPILDDSLVEFNEDIPIFLLNPTGRPINPLARYARVTILYDEQPPGAADREWNPDRVPYTTPPFNLMPGANNQVHTVAVQPDNKAIIGGDFTAVNTIPRNRIARFNADGSLDTNFLAYPNTGADGFVTRVIVIPTNMPNAGKILVAGDFSSFNGVLRKRIARLNPDGSVDQLFNPGAGANGTIYAMELQSDGKIVIGGDFTTFENKPRLRVARLNPDGSLDPTFAPPGGADGRVNSIAIMESTPGYPLVYIGGNFSSVNGEMRRSIARLYPDGTLDYTFNPGTGADGPVYAIAVQTNGAVIIGGSFTEIDSKPRNNIARLNLDGSLDLTFNPGSGANDTVYSIVLRPGDDRAYIGGRFTEYNHTRRMGLALLRPDGTLDTTFMDTAYNQFAGLIKTFSFEPNHFVRSIAVQPDGNLMIGGSFTNIGGNFARYINDLYTYNPVWTRQDKVARMNVARVIGTWGGNVDTNGNFIPNPPQGPGNIEFITSNYFIDENQPVINVTLTRSEGTLGTIGVVATTSDRLAIAGFDYGATSTTNMFTEWWGFSRSDGYPGPVYYTVPIIDDTDFEGNETFDIFFSTPFGQINLGGEYIPLGGAIGGNMSTVTIVDNDFKPGTIAFSSAIYATNENSGYLVVNVIRTNGSDGTVSVDYFTKDGTALAGKGLDPGDYTSLRGTLTFAPGVTNLTISIPLYDDVVVEPDESFYLVLTNASGGAKLPGGTPASFETTTCLIIDNDLLSGRVQFESANYSILEGYGQVAVTLLRRGGSVGPLSVSVITSNETAIAGQDYIYISNRVTWVNNDTAPKTVIIPIIDDQLVEGNETFKVALVNPSVQGGIGNLDTATVTIVDDDSYGTFQFSQDRYYADENGTGLNITVLRIGGSSGSVSVNYSTVDGSAIAGAHYVATSGTLTFAPGEVSKSFKVQMLDNSVQDGERYFTVVLSNATGGSTIGTASSAQVGIIDNESVTMLAGSIDTGFKTDAGPDKPVHSIAIQPDGFILIGGEFTSYNSIIRRGVARLDPIGRIDTKFDVGVGFNDVVKALALQPDGRIIVGGFFTNVSGVSRSRIARLNRDGTIDLSFNPGAGADNAVYAVAIQNDGRVLVGGAFNTFDGVNRPGIVRLNPDGKINLSFDVGAGVEGVVYTIAIQSDGKILIGGKFNRVNYLPYTNIARLNLNGSVDTTFNPGLGADGAVRAIVVQTDGKIVIGGSFTNFNGQARNFIARLNRDGSVDSSFMNGEVGANGSVYALALQADEKIIVAGSFTRFNGVTRNGITRLNPDGTTDLGINFGTGANAYIGALAIQPDRKILVGGGFTLFDGKPRNYITRLHGGSLAGSGTFQFSTPYYTVNEDESVIKLTILRRGGTFGTASVLYATVDGTARAGEDYVAVTNRVEFAPGEVAMTIGIPVINDTIVEETENFYLYLDDATGGADIGIVPVAMVNIVNDDCVLGFSQPEFRISENAPSGVAAITVVRQGSSIGTLAVNCYTISNIFGFEYATPYEDFYPTNELLVFEPGVTSLTFNVYIRDDAIVEPNEKILLQLSDWQSTATVYPGFTNAVLTILDNEPSPGVIEFARTNFTVFENKKFAEIELIRTGGTFGLVSVKAITVNGTAVDGTDFIGGTNTVYFTDNESNKTLTIQIINDNVQENDELFYIYLSNPTGGATLGLITNAAVKIYDDDYAASYVKFAETNFVVSENQTNAVITVFRLGDVSAAASVDYEAYGLTATAGRDFLPVSGTLRWSAGDDAPKYFFVPLVDDTISESDETVRLVLRDPSAGTQIATAEAILTIVDDDINNYGANNTVRAVAFDQDRNVYIGGDFTVVNGMVQNRISRLTTNATVDTTFSIGAGFNDSVHSIVLNTNGQIVVGGNFTRYNGQVASRVIILDTNGLPVLTFNSTNGPNGTVRAMALDILSNLTIFASSAFGDQNSYTNVVQVGARSGTINLTFQFPVPIESPTNTNAMPVYLNTFEIEYGSSMIFRTNIFVQASTNPLAPPVVGNVILNFGPGTNDFFTIYVNRGSTNGTAWTYGGTVTVGGAGDRKIYIGGDFSIVGSSAMNRIARLLANGNVDLSFNPGVGANDAVYAIAVQTNGQVIIAGAFTSYNRVTRNRIARLNADGSVDTTFEPGLGADGTIRAIAIQPDGRIIIAGDFSTVCGVPRARIARLNYDGTIDLTFDPELGVNGSVRSLAIQDDGRIIIAGDFTQVNGNYYNRIARLNPDGSIDASFYPGKGANAPIYSVALAGLEAPLVVTRQPQGIFFRDRLDLDTGSPYGTLTIDYDFALGNNNIRVYYGGALLVDLTTNGIGSIVVNYGPGTNTVVSVVVNETVFFGGSRWSYTLTVSGGTRRENRIAIGGQFTRFNEEPRGRIAILNQTGLVNGEFYPSAAPRFNIYAVAIYTNTADASLVGKVLVGGNSTAIVGVNLTNLARLDINNIIDTNFNLGLGPNGDIRSILIQQDSSVLVGGSFTDINGTPRAYIARIFPNGMLDPYFNNCDCYNGGVNSIVLQPDGKILVGGAFTLANGAPRNRIARIYANGIIDLTFNPGKGANDVVYSVALQNDGRVLVGGQFTMFDEKPIKGIARLNADGSVDSTFIPVEINGAVRSIAVADDGKILIGGSFSITNQNYYGYGIARLNPDGSLDLTFNPGTGANDYVSDIKIDDRGRIVVVGAFTMFNNRVHNRIVRLNADGSFDTTISFGQGANNVISAVAIDRLTGRIIIGGAFSEFNNAVAYGVARISGEGYAEAGELQFGSVSYDALENAGSVAIPVVRNYGATNSVAVSYRTINNTAIAGADYVEASGVLQFEPGEVVKYIPIGIIDNNSVSLARSFKVELYGPSGGATLGTISSADVNILEDDSIIRFEAQEFTVVEGITNGRVTVVRDGSAQGTVMVQCSTGTNGTAEPFFDFIPTTALLVFNPGIQRQTFNVQIVDDTLVEPIETVELMLSNLLGSATLGLSNAVLKIIDNDVGPGVISFATNYYTVVENNPIAVITLIRTNGYSGVVSVNISAGIGGTATAGQDYVATNGVVVFGENETVKTFNIRIFDDNVLEGNETILLRLSNPGGGATIGIDSAALVIIDDERVGSFVFSKPEYIVSEGVGAAIVEVQRIGGSIGQASVTVMTSGGSATPGLDYTAISNVLYFANGETNKTIEIQIIDDSIVEMPETAGLILINPTDGATIGAQGSANIVIVDNETSISFVNQTYFVNETGRVAVVNVVRYGNTNTTVSARYNTSDGTAIAGLDYLATNGVVEFLPGQTNNYIFVPIIDDTIPESNEVFNVTLSNPSPGAGVGPVAGAQVVIIDNDIVLNFSAPTYTVVESFTNVVITVIRSGDTNQIVAVDYVIGGGTATPFPNAGFDYIATNGTLVFAAGQITNSFSVTIFDDALVEGNETLNLGLVNATGGAIIGSQGTAVLVIEDNDSTIGFSQTNYVVAEKATNAVITLIRRGIATGEVSVVFSTSNLTAIAGQDYLYTSNVVRWTAGDLAPKTILVPIIDDAIVEGAENVALILSSPTGGAVIETNFATLTIVDNAGFISFSSQYYRANEGGYAVINLIRSGGSNGVVSVDYSVSGGTATPNVDFLNPSGRVVFADGEVIKNFLIPIVNDGVIEGPEAVIFSLTNPQGGALVGEPSSATLTIYDSQVGVIDPAGTILASESFSPPNNIVEPNETVTILFGLRNSGAVDTTNLVATLLPGNGVSNIRTNTQSYGVLVAGGSPVYRPFTFTATGTNGASVIARLQLSDGGMNLGIVSFTILLGRFTSQFANANPIIINDNTNATPYPSVINVSGVPGVVSKVVVTLNGIQHAYPSDIDILLVSPDGRNAILMSDAGNGFAINNVNLTFDASATAFLPENGQIVSGTYRPTNYFAADVFPPTAPSGPYDSDLNVFNGINPNGYWALYVVDDDRMDSGSISGGWSISIMTTEGVLPSPDLALNVVATPAQVYIGEELTYIITVTNRGSGEARSVVLNAQLPTGFELNSVENPYGQSTTNLNIISAYIGSMPPGSSAIVRIKGKVMSAQLGEIRGWVTALEYDRYTPTMPVQHTVIVNSFKLNIRPQGGNSILLSWPADGGNYVIESTPAIGQPWSPVTNASQPGIVNGNYNVNVPVSGGSRFFRLRKQ